MSVSEVFNAIFSVILIIFLIGMIFIIIYCAASYFDLKFFLKKCDKDFGVGNYTFTNGKEGYECSLQNQDSLLHQTITQDCFENSIRINCSEMEK